MRRGLLNPKGEELYYTAKTLPSVDEQRQRFATEHVDQHTHIRLPQASYDASAVMSTKTKKKARIETDCFLLQLLWKAAHQQSVHAHSHTLSDSVFLYRVTVHYVVMGVKLHIQIKHDKHQPGNGGGTVGATTGREAEHEGGHIGTARGWRKKHRCLITLHTKLGQTELALGLGFKTVTARPRAWSRHSGREGLTLTRWWYRM